jgi:hypothetical protein
MTIAAFALPVESALPVLRPALAAFGVAVFALRPLLGFGILAAFLWLFKPLLRGLARAALILVRPRASLAQRTERRNLRSIVALNRMARELDTQQPNLAAELRLLAARG